MTTKPWKLISEKIAFEKYGRKVIKQDYVLPNGKPADFYVRDEKDACCIVPITQNNEVILVKQFRPGPNKVLLELPGGVVDKEDTTPESAVIRELLAETGYEGNVKFAGKCWVDAYSKRTKYCYVATDCQKAKNQELEATEFIEVVQLSLPEFQKLLRSGELTDVEVGYMGLDFLGLL